MEKQTSWELLNPEGTVQGEAFRINPHPQSLAGKTVLLRWNGKHNGDVFLNRIGELFVDNVKDIRILKSWEIAVETKQLSSNPDVSQQFARKLADFKPDIVIGAQGD